ncbi:MAG: hypothetical protein MUC88_08575 [Planctomycetes bacterium]|nr:hypothetical protein [Planctomycetota bacterium]
MRGIYESGPVALLPLAQRSDLPVQPAYASKCHLCFDLRRRLVEPMAREFHPRHVYEVTPAPRHAESTGRVASSEPRAIVRRGAACLALATHKLH